MLDIATMIEELRVHAAALREGGVSRLDLAADGRVLLSGAGWQLLLGDEPFPATPYAPLPERVTEAEPPTLPEPAPEAAPALNRKPGGGLHQARRVPTQAAEEVCGFVRADGALCGRMKPADRGHMGRHGSWTGEPELASMEESPRVTLVEEVPASTPPRSLDQRFDDQFYGRGGKPVSAPVGPDEKCPKCGRFASWDLMAIDEHGDPDPHCAQCGVRPTRLPTAEESADPHAGRRARSGGNRL